MYSIRKRISETAEVYNMETSDAIAVHVCAEEDTWLGVGRLAYMGQKATVFVQFG